MMRALPLAMRPCRDRRTRFLFLLLPLLAVYYALPLAIDHRLLLLPAIRGLTFNDMLAHLLRGRFDVDPRIIGDEGFVRDGRTYAYFGIFPALLRLPLLAFGRLETTDITWQSMLGAVVFGVFFKLRAVAAIYRQLPDTPWSRAVFLALVASLAFGGAQVQFLKPSIYQEVVSWGGALAAAFVYCAVRGLLIERRFGLGRLLAMALLAGLALLTRVTFGIALYAGLTLLVLTLAWPEAARGGAARCGLWLRRLLAREHLLPLLILLLFALLCGGINLARWGDPFTFADLHLQIIERQSHPDRLVRLSRYGEFNPDRLWFGLLYYWLPIWVIVRPDGQFLFHAFQQRMIDSAELPPSSFFLTDPLLLLLCGAFLHAVWRRRWAALGLRALPAQALALLAGFASAIFLILIAISMTFRYRMEFYPFLELGAFLGFPALCATEPATPRPWLVRLVFASTILGILASHLLMLLYRISPFGPPNFILRTGLIGFYHARWIGWFGL